MLQTRLWLCLVAGVFSCVPAVGWTIPTGPNVSEAPFSLGQRANTDSGFGDGGGPGDTGRVVARGPGGWGFSNRPWGAHGGPGKGRRDGYGVGPGGYWRGPDYGAGPDYGHDFRAGRGPAFGPGPMGPGYGPGEPGFGRDFNAGGGPGSGPGPRGPGYGPGGPGFGRDAGAGGGPGSGPGPMGPSYGPGAPGFGQP